MMIPTTVQGVEGFTDSALMKRREVRHANFDEDGVLHDTAEATEWYLEGELVHRSCHVTVHRMPDELKTIVGLAAANKNEQMKQKESLDGE